MRIRRDMLAESLHTALRKCCDSQASHEAWKAFRDLDDVLWAQYLDLVFERIDGIPLTVTGSEAYPEFTLKTRKSVVSRLKQASEDWASGEHGDDTAFNLRMLFRKFSKADWEGLAGFLPYSLEAEPEASNQGDPNA